MGRNHEKIQGKEIAIYNRATCVWVDEIQQNTEFAACKELPEGIKSSDFTENHFPSQYNMPKITKLKIFKILWLHK